MKFLPFFLCVIISLAAQQPAEVEFILQAEDHSGSLKELYFGLDPAATDLIDTAFGESPLPPFPPTGAFECRFELPNLDGTYKDFRNGDSSFTGDIEHFLRYQSSDSVIVLRPLLPEGLLVTFIDHFGGIVLDTTVSNNDEVLIDNPGGLNRIKMIVHYQGFLSAEENKSEIPELFYLHPNFPNPFNPATKIIFDLPEYAEVSINVYDITGSLVKRLLTSAKPAGTYHVDFDASELTSGIYIYRMTAGEYTASRKMILLK